ncbi:unnamed protein product [Lactuca virosa]|uniref:Exostosin GT47 domain-containing protein n=1 Tax=Lactuca virosa TaxID=75947 RepID=A0AAU9N345_9ASTR|nr:unnamed protein product [Lactuca virosa]
MFMAMTSIPEKGAFIFRSLTGVIAISILLLILSSLLLLQFGDSSLAPRSIYKLIIVKPVETSVLIELKSAPIVASSCNESCPKSNPIKPSICDQTQALLKVFMYDLPPEFHFGLIGWRGDQNQIWPNVSNLSQIPSYPSAINIQHSMEYWLTLDLLSSASPNVSRPCTAILVKNSTQSDVIFVPFFSSWSYNRQPKIHGDKRNSVDYVLQERLVEFLKNRKEWRRSGGKDHLVMAHHPNSLLFTRTQLGSAMLLLADFGRYPTQIANIDKDIIAPYKHVVRRLNGSDSPSFEKRPVLVFFQGGIHRKDGGRIRQILYDLLKDEKEVHFTFGRPSPDEIHMASIGMTHSKFCLSIAGDTPSSNRLFDAIVSHCAPVIISDDIELPFEDVLDYTKFAIFVRASDAARKGYLMKLLRRVQREKWTQMWERLKQIAPHFEYQYPSQPGDAVDMIWQAVHRKVSSRRSKVHRQNRYQMSQKFLNEYKTVRVFPFSKLVALWRILVSPFSYQYPSQR